MHLQKKKNSLYVLQQWAHQRIPQAQHLNVPCSTGCHGFSQPRGLPALWAAKEFRVGALRHYMEGFFFKKKGSGIWELLE